MVDTIWQDLRYGGRVLCRNPGFSAMALSILAIGIASATTIFSFVDAVLLKPLPYEHGDRIVRMLERRPNGGTSGISPRAYLDWRTDNTVFEQMAVQQQGLVTMTGASDAVPLRLTTSGSVVGIAWAYAGIAWLARTVPPGILPSEASVRLDARVVAFALTVSVVTGILFGLMPALRGSRSNLAGAMGTRGTTPSVALRSQRPESSLSSAPAVAATHVVARGSGSAPHPHVRRVVERRPWANGP
jgi:hypothetical protein